MTQQIRLPKIQGGPPDQPARAEFALLYSEIEYEQKSIAQGAIKASVRWIPQTAKELREHMIELPAAERPHVEQFIKDAVPGSLSKLGPYVVMKRQNLDA